MMVTLLIFICVISQIYVQGFQLTPQENDVRSIFSLDGLWNFYLNGDGSNNGTLSGDENDLDLFLMPVPSSYNDIVTTIGGRDHIGLVTYERTFLLPSNWLTGTHTIWIRFGSVCYNAKVYINGQLATTHEFGHLPFSANITSLLQKDENTVRVIVDNTLSLSTIPQGQIIKAMSSTYAFPFFHYAGIDRSVILYKTPNMLIGDITISTSLNGTTGIIHYNITGEGGQPLSVAAASIYDQDGTMVFSRPIYSEGTIKIPDANLWWPYLMSDTPGYLYRFEATVEQGDVMDYYSQTFGFRELSWDSTSFSINGKPIYFRGFARHEDSDFRGKGLDLPIIVRDHNLLRWIGANSYRTSSYPYSEEVMDLADRLGIMIIDETSAVNLLNFNYPGVLENHKQVIQKLITRDKNHPSVVMWSLAADPVSGIDGEEDYFRNFNYPGVLENHKQVIQKLITRDKNRPSVVMWSLAANPKYGVDGEEDYFREITDFAKGLDKSRPITIPTNNGYKQDTAAQFTDIVSINKYEAWLTYAGNLDVIIPELESYVTNWHTVHKKPVIVTEYGCDKQEGYHALPEYTWSEEYQEQLLGQHFEAFDNLRENPWFVGEMVNNFADFKSPQSIIAVGGSRKGIFTRQRQPKSSAFVVRKRYWHLAQELDNATIPTDLDIYSTKNNKRKVQLKEEL